ncbi:MAG TPA: methyl-accepting chemotaxis protein [Chloroflexia bacterium]|nr:methyl-accepting chemotaxis protein [Chloroflexia bacterium]
MRIVFRPQDWPIAIKFLVAFLVIALVPLVVVGILSQGQARDGLLTEARRNLENTSRRTSATIDDFLRNRIADLQQTASLDPVVRFVYDLNQDRNALGPNNTNQTATFSVLKSKATTSDGQQTYLAIASRDGQVELTSNNTPGQEGTPLEGELRDLSNEIYFQQAMKGQTYISDPKLVTFQDKNVEAVMYVASPVKDARGAPSGVILQRLSLNPIWQIVNNDFAVAGTGSYTMLIDDTNNLAIKLADSRTFNRPELETTYLFNIMRPLPTLNRGPWVNSGRFLDNFNYNKANNNGEILPNLVDVLNRTSYDPTNPFFTTSFTNGDKSEGAQVAYAPITSRPSWRYFVFVPDSTYTAAANNITTTVLIAMALAVLVVFLLAFVLARTLTAPVRRITRVLGRIGMGDFTARVPSAGGDELGRLGDSLNAMFDNTLSLIQSREEKEVLQDRITHLLEEISTVAEGDLTVQAEVTADITGAIADSFNLMIEELRKIIINIQNATGQASAIFDQVVLNFQQIDKVSDQQANRVLNVSSSVGGMNRSIQQVSEAAAVSANVAQEARQNARQGGEAVTQTIAGMNRIRSNVQETSKKIKRLGESSQQIGEIVKLIDDIADQTNMLALNAAIQAAMAGEQGKGFSVVSEEVRRLAERSAAATREIAALVKSIQDDTAEAVIAMEESTREVVDGSRVADEAGKALAAIEAVVDRLATLITNISVVSRQQAISSTDIARSMAEISRLTQEASALRRQSAEAVQLAAHTSEELRVSVSAFRVLAEPGRDVSGADGNYHEVLDFTPQLDEMPGLISNDSGMMTPSTGSQYYQYIPSASSIADFEKPGAFQPPAGDGEAWPERSQPQPVVRNIATPPAAAKMDKNSQSEEATEFDLNKLLSDEPIFEPFMHGVNSGEQSDRGKDDGEKKRSLPLG